MDKNNAKAIFRKGQANTSLNNQEIGLEFFRKAHRLVPYDKKIIEEIRKVQKSMKDYSIIEKNIYSKMFRR